MAAGRDDATAEGGHVQSVRDRRVCEVTSADLRSEIERREEQDALLKEVQQLKELVYDLGMHLTMLCNHEVNWANRYDTANGRPCAGCYDARDRYEAWKAAQQPAARSDADG